MKTHLAAPTARRATQIVVWTLLVVFAALSAWALGHPDVAHTAPHYALVGTDGSSTPISAQQVQGLYALGSSSNSGTVAPQSMINDYPARHWLSAVRWDSVGLRATNSDWHGLQNPTASFGASVGGFLFTLGGLAWSFTFRLVGLAMSLDVVATAGKSINAAAGQLGSGIWSSGIVALIILMLIFTLAGAVLRNGKANVFSLLVGCIVPLAAMQLLLGAVATSSHAADPTKTSSYALTPAGLAHRGSVAVSSVVEGIATGMMDANIGQQALGTAPTSSGPADPCRYYYASLNKTYEAASNEKTGYTSKAYVLLGKLWLDTYADSLAKAQYGDDTEGKRAVCHHMEWQQDIPTAEHAALAGVGDKSSPYYGFAAAGKGDNYSPFQKIDDPSDFNTQNILWIACDYSTSTVRKEWKSDGSSGDGDRNKQCSEWKSGNWKGDDGDHDLEFKKSSDAADDGYSPDSIGYRVVVTNMGQSGDAVGSRIGLGLTTMLTSFAYAAALIMPAFGCALATAGLALMLSLLPFTLLLLAVPGKNGGQAGKKLLKMTGSFLVSKSLFLVLIALLVQFIAIFNTVLGVN